MAERATARAGALAVLVILALVLGACGKKGPLRLPEAAPASAPPPAAPEAEDEPR